MKRFTMLALPLLMTLAGCIRYTKSVISFRNTNAIPAVIKLIATDPSEKPIFRNSYDVPAATTANKREDSKNSQPSGPADKQTVITAGKSQTPEVKVARNGRIKLEYQPQGSSAWLPMDEFVVPDSDQLVSSIYNIPSLDSLNEVTSTNQLRDIASQLGAEGQPVVGKLVDMVPMLSKLIIANKQPDGKYADIDRVALHPPTKMEYREPSVIKQRIYANRDIMGSFKVNVPIYGNLEASLSNSDLYSLNVEIKHYEYINDFEFSTSISQLALSAEKRTLLSSLKTLLDKNPDAMVLTIDRFHVIESAVFAIQKGVKLAGGASASLLAVLTTNGTFSFSQGEESVVSMAQDVLNIRYKQFGTAKQISAFISETLSSSQKSTSKLKSTVVQPDYQFSQRLVTDERKLQSPAVP